MAKWVCGASPDCSAGNMIWAGTNRVYSIGHNYIGRNYIGHNYGANRHATRYN